MISSNSQKTLLSYDYINKMPVFKPEDIPAVSSAVVSIKLRVISEYDLSVPHSIAFSDWLSGQRGYVKSYKFIYKYNKPVIQVHVVTTIRRGNLFNLFDYLLVSFFSVLKLRLNSIKVSHDSKSFSFFIKDVNFFYNIPNFLYNFNNQVSVKFFFKKSYTRKHIKLFLSNYPSIYQFLQ